MHRRHERMKVMAAAKCISKAQSETMTMIVGQADGQIGVSRVANSKAEIFQLILVRLNQRLEKMHLESAKSNYYSIHGHCCAKEMTPCLNVPALALPGKLVSLCTAHQLWLRLHSTTTPQSNEVLWRHGEFDQLCTSIWRH